MRPKLTRDGAIDAMLAGDIFTYWTLDGAKALLVCDLNMPDMDGVEFIKAIAKRKFAGAVLILSGADATVRGAAAHLALAYGVNLVGTYEKPLAIDRLAAALGAALEA